MGCQVGGGVPTCYAHRSSHSLTRDLIVEGRGGGGGLGLVTVGGLASGDLGKVGE